MLNISKLPIFEEKILISFAITTDSKQGEVYSLVHCENTLNSNPLNYYLVLETK